MLPGGTGTGQRLSRRRNKAGDGKNGARPTFPGSSLRNSISGLGMRHKRKRKCDHWRARQKLGRERTWADGVIRVPSTSG